MRVLLLGDTSFVATGLRQLLQSRGASVVAVQRNLEAGEDPTVFVGDPTRLTHLALPAGRFDAVINFVLLKDRSVEENVAFVEEVAKYVDANQVPHLIHLSSISSYADELSLVTEYSRTEDDWSKKGSYGRLKVATDVRLTELFQNRPGLTLVRPGFVLGSGLGDPIVGTGARIPGNNVLVLGASNAILPIVTREQVHEALWASLNRGPGEQTQVLLLADRDSPTRAEYLRHCTRGVGAGRRIIRLGSAAWLSMGAGGRAVAKATKMDLDPWRIARSLTRVRTYDGTVTETLLGVPIKVNWKKELQHSLPGQFPNFDIPKPLQNLGTLPPRAVTLIGCGGIVASRHLPALRRLGLDTNVSAYDVTPRSLDGLKVERLPVTVDPAPLMIVASPGPAHIEALDLLPEGNQSILVEKPLCLDEDELDQWCDFAATRTGFTGVVHNYRAKANVQQLLLFLNTYNPGRILSASVTFHSPPVAHDSSWRKNERRARTLLTDYAIHFMDVAMMFGQGQWSPKNIRFTLNHSSETDFIGGVMSGDVYDVAFNLRQSFGPRVARVEFVFQNYRVLLSFFPDVFNVEMSGDDFSTSFARGARQARETARKVTDKLRGRDSDHSHDLVIAAAANGEGYSIEQVAPFYRAVLALSEQVYGHYGEPKSARAPKAEAI